MAATAFLAAALLVAASGQNALAQQPDARQRVDNLVTNAAIGAVAGGVRAAIGQKPIRAGVIRGALGGATLGVARQVAGTGFSGSGAAGRVINAFGVSAIDLAGSDTLALLLPVGPLTLEIRPRSADRITTRVNVWTSVIMTASLLDSESRLDLSATLSAGAPVFTRPADRMPWGTGEAGFAHPGVIFLNRDALEVTVSRRKVLAHESIHILQWDAYHATVMRPVERSLSRQISGDDWINRHLELSILAPLSAWAIAARVSHERRPWEREAYRLAGELPPHR